MDRCGNEKLSVSNLVLPMAKGSIEELKIVALNADGYAVEATKEENLRVAGVSVQSLENRNEDGEEKIKVKRGAFIFNNAGDIMETDILKDCYIKNSVTVTLDDKDSSRAGKILAVDGDGITVLFE